MGKISGWEGADVAKAEVLKAIEAAKISSDFMSLVCLN